ncbi:hypothetical protein ACFL9T_06460 [Thermodesulfobacteriota bacterium]
MKKRNLGIVIAGVLFLFIVGFTYTPFMGLNHAGACNWGQRGGGDYAPQQRGSRGTWLGSLSKGDRSDSLSMTKEQAHDVVASHIKRLNPDLEIGKIQDAGGFYEAEVLSGETREVVERLGVDKRSGRLIPIN